ncbi:MAG: aminomethyl-transferring glycine dehydrogenase subunit GcvPA [Tissierellia bacterium]|nr:aminomethyl-transferring glycine dehydrogenase subunit GcvPA [Tissierellia bacterium]
MTHPYIPGTQEDKKAMLEALGLESTQDLYKSIPDKFRLDGLLDLPEGLSELDLDKYLRGLAKMNKTLSDYPCFLGAGAYDHYQPSLVDALSSRSEFFTAYTPYQPEISQGTLQSIFEFQSLIARLTGMDIANASLYDGGTACAEAAIMACAKSRKSEILVSKALAPSYREVLETYAKGQNINVRSLEIKNGVTDLEDLRAKLSNETAGVLIQSPNFFGLLEDVEAAAEITHGAKKAAMILSTDPFSLGLLRAPGDMGVDIVVGEGQSLGLPLSFGGPYLGILATNKSFMRKIPGRLIGQTVDKEGKRSFVLTLAAREQHIKRERATSNICTNQGLMALMATIYMATLGKKGMKEAAYQATQKAHYAYDRLLETGLFEPLFEGPFFLEFALKSKIDPKKVNEVLMEGGIIGGYDLGRSYPDHQGALLFAVTEKRTKEEIDQMVRLLEGIA